MTHISRNAIVGRWAASVLCLFAVSGCSALNMNTPPPSAPFFTPTAKDKAALAHLTRELNTMAAQCADSTACDQVHYARGLVALFESREAARTSFRRVTQTNQANPTAASSALWLQLLDGGGLSWVSHEQEHAFLDITAQLVREWIDRKLVELRQSKKAVAGGRPEPSGGEPALMQTRQKSFREPDGEADVQALQRQMKERDARIAELSSQLEALKAIDRDVDERKKLPRPPAVLTPTTSERHH